MEEKENKDILNEILEKKFKLSNGIGYDPTDVDKFFDEVMVYIQNTNETLDKKNKEISQSHEKNQTLNQEIANLNERIVELNNTIQEYKQEGYGHHSTQLKEIQTSNANESQTLKQETSNKE